MTEMSEEPTNTGYDFERILNELRGAITSYISRVKEYTIDTVEHLIIACVLYILICIIFYLAITVWKLNGFNRDVKHAKRVLIVIAHPDDECMFFGPTIMNFTKRKGCTVYLMCLSTGQNYGMGKTRKEELYESCKILGIEEECIIVHNHTNLPDAMDVRWPTEVVSQLILNHVAAYDVNTLITFDRHGVSSHSNHYSIYYAVANLIIDQKLPKNCAVFVLESVNIIRKYWLFLDMPLSFILSRIRYMVSFGDRSIILKAMKQHKSQMLWFRFLYIYFSRYLLINTLQQMNLVDIELDLEIDD